MATPESGSAEGVSPELILVSGDDVAERARAGLAPIVPTDERLLEESAARVKAGLRTAAPARRAPAPIPVTEAPQAVAPIEAPPPGRPRRRRSRRGLRLAFAVALVPIAVVGAALGAGWNPVGSGNDNSAPETQAAPPPPPGHVGTATSHVTTSAPVTTHHTSPPAPSTKHHSAPTTARAPTTAPTTHAATTRGLHPTKPARTTAPAPSTTRRTPTTAPATTHAKPKPKPKPKPPPQGPIKPSRVFAWPAAPNATFYLVRFLRGGVQVFSDRVRQPRLTLPTRFVLKPGRYRWTVLPALGTAKNPRYGPPVVDSQFVVAG